MAGTQAERERRAPRGARHGGAGHAAARRARARRAGQDGRAARGRRRPGRARHLLGRVPARRPVQPAAPVRAGQDGRRHHPVGRTATASPAPTSTWCPTRPCPPARPAPATARPSGSPARSRCRSCRRQRGDGRHQPLRRRLQAPAAGHRPAARSRQPGAADARALQGPPRRRAGRPDSRSRSRTSSPLRDVAAVVSAARWSTASPTRSRR